MIVFVALLLFCHTITIECKQRSELLASPDRKGYGADTTGENDFYFKNIYRRFETLPVENIQYY
jgi:hypothetical protein